jgi:hypothetical protein
LNTSLKNRDIGIVFTATQVDAQDVVVAVESFLLEIGDDEWAELSCLVLADPSRDIRLTTFSQVRAA